MRFVLFLALLLSPALAVAQTNSPAVVTAQAPAFSQGPTLPGFRLTMDNKGHWTTSRQAAGAGYGVAWNFLPGSSGTVRWLSLGLYGFVAEQAAATSTVSAFALTAMACIGTYNNLVRLCPAYDLVNVGAGSYTGLLISPTKQNYSLFLTWGFNFDIGGTNLNPVMQPVAGVADAWRRIVPNQEPPNYWRL